MKPFEEMRHVRLSVLGSVHDRKSDSVRGTVLVRVASRVRGEKMRVRLVDIAGLLLAATIVGILMTTTYAGAGIC